MSNSAENEEEAFARMLRREFLQEADEIVTTCEKLFLELEADPENMEIVNHIFRIAHTLKGSGMAAGFKQLGSFAHKFETLLDAIRSGNIKLEEQLFNLLLIANDKIREFIDCLNEDQGSEVSCAEVESQLDAYMNNSPEPQAETAPAAQESIAEPSPGESILPSTTLTESVTKLNQTNFALYQELPKLVAEAGLAPDLQALKNIYAHLDTIKDIAHELGEWLEANKS
ncbi:MAG: Hpt domain-containing protein [Zetaproteobacteria bacterium]|nr:Hpt domain-containing protein [Zetaproteobacteria bacterium]